MAADRAGSTNRPDRRMCAPTTGRYVTISPAQPMTQMTTEHMIVYARTRPTGPAVESVLPIPRKMPVPITEPMLMNVRWRALSLRWRPSVDTAGAQTGWTLTSASGSCFTSASPIFSAGVLWESVSDCMVALVMGNSLTSVGAGSAVL